MRGRRRSRARADLLTAASIALAVEFGNADTGVGGTASVLGTLKGTSAVVNGATDADLFTVHPSTTTPVTVNGQPNCGSRPWGVMRTASPPAAGTT